MDTKDDAHEEGLTQASLELMVHLEARATELGRPDLANVPMEFKPMAQRPLVGAWMLGQWRQEIVWLAQNAQTSALQRYADQVSKCGLSISRTTVDVPSFR